MRGWSTSGIAAVAAATLIAAGGVAVNLHLLDEQHDAATPRRLTFETPAGSGTDPSGTSTTSPSVVPSTGSTITPPPSTTGTTIAPATTVPSVSSTYTVGTAGTVTLAVRGGAIEVVAVRPQPGWTVVTERERTDEVELSFRNTSSGAEASLHARLDDGALRVETEDEGPDD